MTEWILSWKLDTTELFIFHSSDKKDANRRAMILHAIPISVGLNKEKIRTDESHRNGRN